MNSTLTDVFPAKVAQQNKNTHAIVIGGSIGGLLAARVLAGHFQHVTILEKDTLLPQGEQRKGVPQGRHTHGLLASGKDVLDRWFPDFSQELIEAGAIAGDLSEKARWFNEGACLAKFRSGLEGLLMTRPFLEGRVRHRVMSLPNVEVKQGFRAAGLTVSADGRRVTGITGSEEEIPADLVVDATGRGSQTAQWLEKIGYAKPQEERVEVALAYTTRFFHRRREQLEGDTVVVIPPLPDKKRGGVMLAQEGDRWTVTLIGHFGQAAPPELDGFIEYARTLPAPYIYDIIKDSQPASEPETMRFPASVRRRYEKLDRFPEGYLVFGDAIASFNPIYGQGMSVAALESIELDVVLNQGTDDVARRFFRRAAKVVDMPWAISVGNDLRIPETVGPRNAGVNFVNWYMSKLHKAAHTDPVPALAFFHVANLLAPPPSVLHPRVAWRVFLRNYAGRSSGLTTSGVTGKSSAVPMN
jgi:2-polyprenyl-6-methoxyphenol hydroxylase-like FAD-dependent oxidoreductase